MRRWFEQLEQFAIEVILEDRKGRRAAMLRAVLHVLSHLYRGIVQMRLWLYRKRLIRERTLGCLVISIGNLTVGGTGKTPVVEKFARALQAGGRRVAILSRGYKSKKLPLLRRLWQGLTSREPYKPRIVSDGRSILLDSRMAGDEPYMLSGLYAIEEMGCDTLLLDDGMQFLRLKHRLEIVLVDRQAPFGNEYLLPRGTLREPAGNLRRASYIFITKSTAQGNEELIRRIRKYNRTAEIIECSHKPQYLEHVLTGDRLPLAWLRGRHVGALSAIAAPKSFEDGLNRLGAKVELTRHFADHHRFTEREVTGYLKRCGNRALDAVITTEKDYVRLPRLTAPEVPIYFLRVEIEILSGSESWQSCVDRICKQQAMMAPERFFG